MAELTEPEEVLPRNSAFHPDNIASVTLLTLLHIKDYLSVIAAKLDDPTTTALEQDYHEMGKFLCPPPFVAIPEVTEE